MRKAGRVTRLEVVPNPAELYQFLSVVIMIRFGHPKQLYDTELSTTGGKSSPWAVFTAILVKQEHIAAKLFQPFSKFVSREHKRE